MIKNYTDVEKAVKFLESIAPYEGAELGEYWISLIDLYQYESCMSSELKNAIISEIKYHANEMANNWSLVEKEQTITRKVKELVYNEKDN